MILPTLELCKTLESDKKIVAGGPVSGSIALSLIVSGQSAQELDGLTSSLPVWPLMEPAVTLLATIEVRAQEVRARLEQMKNQTNPQGGVPGTRSHSSESAF